MLIQYHFSKVKFEWLFRNKQISRKFSLKNYY